MFLVFFISFEVSKAALTDRFPVSGNRTNEEYVRRGKFSCVEDFAM